MFLTRVPRHQNEVEEIHYCHDLRQQRFRRADRLRTQHSQYQEGDHECQQRYSTVPAFIAHGAHRALVQPGQDKQDGDSAKHDQHTPELGIDSKQRHRDCAQHGIERCVVPNRRYVFRRLQWVSFLEVGNFKEIATHLWRKEQNGTEDEQEHDDRRQVMVHRVIRVERHAVYRLAIRIFVLFDFDAVRVIRTHFVQGQNVQHHQRNQHDWQGHNMQSEETV